MLMFPAIAALKIGAIKTEVKNGECGGYIRVVTISPKIILTPKPESSEMMIDKDQCNYSIDCFCFVFVVDWEEISIDYLNNL